MKQLTTKMSSSLKVTSKLFYIQYGTGAVIGSIASDTFRFAGFSVPADFGLVKTVTDDFVDFAIDGVMGLGPAKGEGQAEEKNDMTTIMETLVKQKVIDKKIYGVALGRASDGENNGVINFGALDPAMYQGELEYIDGVRGKGLWELPMVKVKVGEQSLKLEGDVRTAIIDTGTSLVLFPSFFRRKLQLYISGLWRST